MHNTINHKTKGKMRNRLFKIEITQAEASLLRIALDNLCTGGEGENGGAVYADVMSVIDNLYCGLKNTLSTIEDAE